MARGAHANGAIRARRPCCDVDAGTIAAEVSDLAVVLQMEVDILDNTTVVVRQDTVLGTIVFELAMVGLTVEAVEVGVESVNFLDE
jgi:hypothetical protein